MRNVVLALFTLLVYVHEIRLNRMYVSTYVGMYVICMYILVL